MCRKIYACLRAQVKVREWLKELISLPIDQTGSRDQAQIGKYGCKSLTHWAISSIHSYLISVDIHSIFKPLDNSMSLWDPSNKLILALLSHSLFLWLVIKKNVIMHIHQYLGNDWHFRMCCLLPIYSYHNILIDQLLFSFYLLKSFLKEFKLFAHVLTARKFPQGQILLASHLTLFLG